MMRRRKLISGLFLIPSLVILIAFFLILATFNIVIQRYISATTNKVIQDKLSLFDNIHNESYEYIKYEKTDYAEFIIPTYYVVLDASYEILYPYQPWSSDMERIVTQTIRDYAVNEPELLKGKTSFKVDAENNTYYVMTRVYEGEYEDYIFIKPSRENSRTYYLLIYTNITPMQKFLDLLNLTLLLLMLGSGILSLLFFFGMAQKIENSLGKLKEYIMKAGRKEAISDMEPLAYEEFNDVATTVRHISLMLEGAEKSQKQFFQNASHELRTPLMSIQGYAEGIRAGVLKNEKNAANIIIEESRKMSDLVDEILFLSKLDTSNREAHLEEIDMKELLYSCSWSLKGIADQNKIEFVHDFPREYIAVYGDEKLLERAIRNIIGNALRYAKSRIGISCKREEQYIRIEICDDGKGIKEKDLPHIFERFYKGEEGKTGIGLAIARSIIKNQGGSIEAENDVGAKFIIRLPLYQKE